MTVSELYRALAARIPADLSCDWDNDGAMCIPDPDHPCRRVLIALDMTVPVIERAVAEKFDLILSHHPLLFHGIKHLTVEDITARRALLLCRAGVAALSFHTRLDAVSGGVNDTLADLLHLQNTKPFGENNIGRIGTLFADMTAPDFAALVAKTLGAPAVTLADAGKTVHRVAVLGGSGGDMMGDALRAGADTYLTGEASHHCLVDAPEMGLNLLLAGHHHTEAPVCAVLADMVKDIIPDAEIEIADSFAATLITK